MTTHSPVAVLELPVSELGIVRNAGGVVTVQHLQPNLQGLVRKAPDAFLARKIIVCEGSTELGVCRHFDRWWAEEKGDKSFAYLGAVPVVPSGGGGSNSPEVALALAKLGYQVAFFGDSDRPLSPDQTAMEKAGVCVLLWADNVAIEQRLTRDLPWVGVQEIVGLAIEDRGRESVYAAVRCRLAGNPPASLPEEPGSWKDLSGMREAIGLAAKEANGGKGWFKQVDHGQDIGEIITKYLDLIPETNLAKRIADLRSWLDKDG